MDKQEVEGGEQKVKKTLVRRKRCLKQKPLVPTSPIPQQPLKSFMTDDRVWDTAGSNGRDTWVMSGGKIGSDGIGRVTYMGHICEPGMNELCEKIGWFIVHMDFGVQNIIELTLTSEGGSTYAAGMFINLIDKLRKKSSLTPDHLKISPLFRIVAHDVVGSAALMIFINGDERFATLDTRFVFHHNRIYLSDDSVDDSKGALQCTTQFDICDCETLGQITKYPSRDWFELVRERRDWFFTATSALTIGLISKIL